MNITDLKIGDMVKYYYPEGIIADTTMGEGILTWVGIGDSIINHNIKIPTKDIICKLEEAKYYKEIPITKEKDFRAELDKRLCLVNVNNVPVPETTYHCPECGVKLWGLCGMPIKQYANTPCSECKSKSKIKSFKFDVSFIRKIEFNQEPYTASSLPNCFFKIEGGKITYHPDNPKNFPESFNGKEFTIEIREKI